MALSSLTRVRFFVRRKAGGNASGCPADDRCNVRAASRHCPRHNVRAMSRQRPGNSQSANSP
jgi:hypothetical protein